MELRERIIQEASKLFSKNGIRSVTMSDIAHNLGISKRTLYEVFKDKEQILETCIDIHLEKATKQMDELIEMKEDVITTMMRIYQVHLAEVNVTNKTLVYDLKKYHPKLYRKVENMRGDGINLFIPLFKRGYEDGLIRDDINYEICIWLMKSQFRTLLEEDYIPTNKFSTNEFIRSIILSFVRGIATPKGYELIDEIIAKINNNENNN